MRESFWFTRRCFLAAFALLVAALLLVIGGTREAAAQASNYAGDTLLFQGGDGEVFIAGLPPGWHLGLQENSEIGVHLEWVPEGQPVKEWRDMIAYQLFPKLIDLKPEQFLTKMADHYAGSCDQVLATDVEPTMINGYPAAMRVLACTRNKATGLGEVTLFRAVAGERAFYVVQRAWRMEPFDAQQIPVTGEELDKGRKLVEFGLACRSQTVNRPCPPGWDPVLARVDRSQATIVYKAKNDTH